MINEIQLKMIEKLQKNCQDINDQFNDLKSLCEKHTKPKIKLKQSNEDKESSRIGLFNCNLETLIDLFGVPHYVIAEHNTKSTLNWQFKLGNSFFTIYDYCIGVLYATNGYKLNDIQKWSVGGNRHDKDFLEKIRLLIKDYPDIRLEV